MLDNKKIKTFFKSRIKNRHTNKLHYHLDVSKIWRKILLIFIVANAIIIGFNVYLFLQINSGEIFIVENNETISVKTIDRALLRNTIDLFEIKEIEFDNLKNNKPKIIDPSL